MPPIDAFLSAVRRRLNARRSLRILLWSLCIGAVALLAVAGGYFAKGYAVPKIWYPVMGGLTLVGAVTAILLRRATPDEASHAADAWFGLKDAVTSHRQFTREAKTGGFYEMQLASTQQAVEGLKVSRIPLAVPARLASVCGLLVLGAGLTAIKATSPEVLARENQESLTAERTEQMRKELEEMIQELEKGTDDPEEQKLLQTDELKKWVAELKSTKDLNEAMRRMAELERKLDRAAKALSQKRDEQLLKQVAEELEKEEDPATRELAKKLKNEQFRDAAKDLESLKPQDDAEKRISDKRRELAKLKAAAKRMAAAARNQSTKNKSSNSRDKEPQDSNPSSEPPLEDQLSELEKDANDYDEALKDMEDMDKLGGKIDASKLAEGDKLKKGLSDKLGKMGSRLKQMAAKKGAASRLQGLARNAGKGQGFLNGRMPSPFAGVGGKKPGDGTIESRREGKDELSDNGQLTQIKGIKGAGPSVIQVESADEGTGVSHRRGEARERTFRRQFESFVNREDVPEDMKQGVKQYFESIHDVEPDPEPAPAEPAPAK
ncbi:MAG: hypothetical protein JWM59_4971 [Verrucomicrobiales bacterium]|nr:hypothetical protein [Verrucomicrobiales bacterium]